MRSISLAKSGINKLRSNSTELKAIDFDGSIKSIPPGEWCIFSGGDEKWIGYVNPQIEEKFPCSYIVSKYKENFSIEKYIEDTIKTAYQKRLMFKSYDKGSRIFYGASDNLAGLIIDLFENAAIIQINTAGVDKHRDFISKILNSLTGVKSYLLDNAKYREKEFLPTFETAPLPDLSITENGLRYKIRSEVLQKVGSYYDHRENRKALMGILQQLNFRPQLGVDLFCYAGAWGLNALSSGVERIDFVDQGEFSLEVQEALKLNGFHDRGNLHRKDVFKFLDEAITLKKTYDVILCDPPAFAKSAAQKDQALEGYSKLHRKVMKSASSKALCVFSSCTHYVDHEEFQKNILDAARKENRSLQLIYTGIQGWDHPISSLADRANYIKSYFYIVE